MRAAFERTPAKGLLCSVQARVSLLLCVVCAVRAFSSRSLEIQTRAGNKLR